MQVFLGVRVIIGYAYRQIWRFPWYIENIPFLASVFVSVRKWIFRPLCMRYLNSAGMNLNWARIKLREKENQLSSWYDRGPLNSVIIFRKRHNISERYDFGTRSVTIFRKDIILVRENILKSDLKMLCFYDFMFRWILPAFIFCWQDPGVRQTDI